MGTICGNKIRTRILLVLAVFALLFPVAIVADDVQPVLLSDQLLTAAIIKGEAGSVSKLMADNFEFTDTQGKTLNKSDSLKALASIKTAGPDSTGVHSYNYGDVAYTIGIQGDNRYMRVWVKQPEGWRLFIYLETPITTRAPLPPGGGNCDNPCKTIPYKPTTGIDEGILEAWQKAKNDEWHPNSADWALRVADEFLIINARTERSKAERVALLAKQQEANEPGPPGDPIHSIRMFDFGKNAAVMLSIHTPYHGGKPYYNVRVWVLRDGRWQLGMSQQTTIESGTPVPPVA
jgi:Domain of unknown function (DUF4440)